MTKPKPESVIRFGLIACVSQSSYPECNVNVRHGHWKQLNEARVEWLEHIFGGKRVVDTAVFVLL